MATVHRIIYMLGSCQGGGARGMEGLTKNLWIFTKLLIGCAGLETSSVARLTESLASGA